MEGGGGLEIMDVHLKLEKEVGIKFNQIGKYNDSKSERKTKFIRLKNSKICAFRFFTILHS